MTDGLGVLLLVSEYVYVNKINLIFILAIVGMKIRRAFRCIQ